MFDYIKEFYQKVGSVETIGKLQEEPINVKRQKVTKETVNSLIRSNDIRNILEIGPGSGFITKGVGEILISHPEIEYDILDFSDSYLESTQNHGFKINHSYSADIASLDFQPMKQYDLIIFEEVIEHLISPFIGLNNINAMLNVNGYLFLTLPNDIYYRYILRTWFFSKAKTNFTFKHSHIAELAVLGMIKLLSMTGFEIVKTDYFCSSIPLIDSFLSDQVGFLTRKITTPGESWAKLQATKLNSYRPE